jgi:hypothetical protein
MRNIRPALSRVLSLLQNPRFDNFYIALLEAMLLDGGMDAATTFLLIQEARSRIPAT